MSIYWQWNPVCFICCVFEGIPIIILVENAYIWHNKRQTTLHISWYKFFTYFWNMNMVHFLLSELINATFLRWRKCSRRFLGYFHHKILLTRLKIRMGTEHTVVSSHLINDSRTWVLESCQAPQNTVIFYDKNSLEEFGIIIFSFCS
jgi:hypothetical protein